LNYCALSALLADAFTMILRSTLLPQASEEHSEGEEGVPECIEGVDALGIETTQTPHQVLISNFLISCLY